MDYDQSANPPGYKKKDDVK